MKAMNEAAERYTRALFEVAAERSNQDRVLAELRVISEAFEKNPELMDFFLSPTISEEAKKTVLKNTFEQKVSQDIYNLLLLLNEKGRMGVLSAIVLSFERLIDESRGVSRGVVRSASTLDPEQRKGIEETVKKVTGKQVILKFEVDPTLVGGLIAKVGGWTFDDSLSSHLTSLRETLNRNSATGH